MKTTMGEGTILAFMEGTRTVAGRYRIKFPYGIGFIRPYAILHGVYIDGPKYVRRAGQMVKEDELMAEGKASSAKLGKNFKLLFGSDQIYLFIRLYSFLISLLHEIDDYLRKNPSLRDPSLSYYNPMKSDKDKDLNAATKLDFQAVIMNLQKVISKTLNLKEYEAFGRLISKKRVHKIAALPRLVEKCADALAKVAEEDLLLHLYDYCQYTGMVSLHIVWANGHRKHKSDDCLRLPLGPHSVEIAVLGCFSRIKLSNPV